ncbi:MAG TPA: ParB N-terminal domain-containing protein [Denitromonas sp.]|nr:ParB N-terminal domain-containing protein [Denitromonas sp.]
MSEIVGVHPYADKFPMLTDAELDELAESIATIGLINPIVVDTAGLILDGRNRLEACNRSGVETVTTVYEGGDVAEFVIGCNVTRRNMTTGARAMATALVLQADGRRKKNDKGEGYWARGSISGLNIDSNINHSWQDRLKECGVILDYKPDLAPAVVAGDIALNDAFTQAEAIRTSAERDKIMAREKAKREKAEAAAEAQRNAEIIADLTQSGAQNYLDLIDGGMTPKAAWAAYREDTRKEREAAERAREVLRDRYTSMAQACLTAASWGEHDDFPSLMADFQPELLNPPQLERYLSLESLLAVQRFAEQLIAWRKSL